MGKAKGDHTPERKRKPQRANNPPDPDDAKKFVPSVDVSSPVWRELAERTRHLKSPRRRAEAESLRLLGEKLGLNRIAETLKGVRAPAEPQVPTPQRRKRGRAGRKRSIPQEQIDEGIRILQSQARMTVEAARATLRAAGVKGEDGPLYRLIIKPAYGGMSK